MGNRRMSPERSLALCHLETAYHLEGIGFGWHQGNLSALFIITVQHTIGIDYRPLVAIPARVVHPPAIFPANAGPVAATVTGPVGAIKIAIVQDDTPVVNIEYRVSPDTLNLGTILTQPKHGPTIIIATGRVDISFMKDRVIGIHRPFSVR